MFTTSKTSRNTFDEFTFFIKFAKWCLLKKFVWFIIGMQLPKKIWTKKDKKRVAQRRRFYLRDGESRDPQSGWWLSPAGSGILCRLLRTICVAAEATVSTIKQATASTGCPRSFRRFSPLQIRTKSMQLSYHRRVLSRSSASLMICIFFPFRAFHSPTGLFQSNS